MEIQFYLLDKYCRQWAIQQDTIIARLNDVELQTM